MTTSTCEAAAQAPARRVHTAGVDLSVEERGDRSAPTIVLLHGYPDTSAVWDLVAAELTGRFHIVTYDVRGAGESARPREVADYRLALLMADLGAVLDATCPDRPVHLVGHDWGSLQGWEAVTTGNLTGRLASYTSISGPSLDHVGAWVRERVRRHRPADVAQLAGQAVRSAYIGVFHTPGVAWAAQRSAGRLDALSGAWGTSLAKAEGAAVDARWPAPTFGHDLAAGMNLYRANIGPKLQHGTAPTTTVPVQLVVARGDRFVPPSLLAGLDVASPRLWWREVDAGHWVPRSQPLELARWIAELVDHVEGAPEAPDLARARRNPPPGAHPGGAP